MKFLKRLFYLILILIALLAITVFLATRFINPNDYKERIVQIVHEKTGRNLTIQGDMELSFFPWIGLKVRAVQLSNATGFQPQDRFARVGEADVSVKLLPLFVRQVEVGKITFKDMTLNLAKNKDGVTNWQDLMTAPSNSSNDVSSTNTVQSDGKKYIFAIAGIDIENADITWDDAQKGQNIELKNVQVKGDNPKVGEFFPFSLTLNLISNKPTLSGKLSLNSDVLIDPTQAVYQLKNLNFIFSPNQTAQTIVLKSKLMTADLNAQTIVLTDGAVTSGDLNAQISLEAENILHNLTFKGELNTEPFNAKKALNALGKSVVTSSPDALQKVSVNTKFVGSASSIDFKPFVMTLDNTNIQGDIAIAGLDSQSKALNFNLALDEVNMDNYLPPKTNAQHEGTSPAIANSTAGSQSAVLSQMDVSGILNIGKLITSNMALSQFSAKIDLKNSLLNVNPISVNVYGGTAHGKISADLKNSKYNLDETFTNIDMTQLAKSGRIVGKANLTTHLTFEGQDKSEIMRSLNGNLQFNVQNGALVGANIPYQVEHALALLKKQPAPPKPAKDQTDFEVLKGTGTFTNGIFSNNDLLAQSPQFKATGNGTANLITQALNYRLLLVGLHTVIDAQGNTVQEERKTPIPVLISGTFDKPVITPDLRALIQSEISQKAIQRVQERLVPRGGRLGNALRQILQ
jgi:AsmA protein